MASNLGAPVGGERSHRPRNAPCRLGPATTAVCWGTAAFASSGQAAKGVLRCCGPRAVICARLSKSIPYADTPGISHRHQFGQGSSCERLYCSRTKAAPLIKTSYYQRYQDIFESRLLPTLELALTQSSYCSHGCMLFSLSLQLNYTMSAYENLRPPLFPV
jgi:hypothetical protein